MMGLGYLYNEQYEECLAMVMQAMLIDPKNDNIKLLLADYFAKTENYSEAIKLCREKISLDQNNAKAWALLAACLDLSGNRQDSLRALAEAINAEPEEDCYKALFMDLLIDMNEVPGITFDKDFDISDKLVKSGVADKFINKKLKLFELEKAIQEPESDSKCKE